MASPDNAGRVLRRQIAWLLAEIACQPDQMEKGRFCPSNSGNGSQATCFDGYSDRPDCHSCWRQCMEKAERGADEQ